MESRIRLVATAISAILIVTACNTAASPSPSASSPAASVPAASAPAASGSAAAGGQQFAGVSVHLLTFNGPQIAEPLQRRAPDFQKLTGATINVDAVALPGHLRQGAARRVDRHEQLRRVRVRPAVDGRLRRSGLSRGPHEQGHRGHHAQLERHRAVLPRLQRDVRRQGLHDPARRRLPHGVLPERPDQDPPKTWDDYLALAKEYNGKDLNGDGTPDYGSCIAKKKGQQSYWWVISVAGRPAPVPGHRRRARSSTQRT